ncbi:hypothetical protein B9Z55_003235 [Caenorhabditis nigoni]|uniref:Insulin-like domain-containing protein n=1 Tax=Caenorhabditis nigoni TaxID=1611254 RepID=A0A2G5VPJ4_9PELO|nr:hypothetical protein B9Z55_003235 [Caenorhabditis nigoni]
MSKIFILVFIVLALAISLEAAGFGRHHLCGARLLDVMLGVCPNGCDPGSDFSFTTACARQVDMDYLKSICCPSA